MSRCSTQATGTLSTTVNANSTATEPVLAGLVDKPGDGVELGGDAVAGDFGVVVGLHVDPEGVGQAEGPGKP